MKRVFKWAGIGLTAVLVIVVVAAIGGFFWLRSSLPQVDGAISVAGLNGPVQIERDDRGVPTIRAASLDDAYFAIGFAHAQDRLFQMDLMRRLGAGRLAEIVGAPAVPTDKLMRSLGLYAMAEQEVAVTGPGMKAALDAYAAGVNAFLTQRRGALPLEYQLLRTEPEAWQPADSLVWGRIMALQLSANWHDERLNLTLKKSLPADLFQMLAPEAHSLAGLPAPWFGKLSVASNNWVIGPAKSRSGAPMLANDPHLGLGAPSIWYLVHIVTPDRSWVGVTSPGMPLLVIGANDSVAWGLTTTGGDTEDLFEERSAPGDPSRYQTPDGTAPFETRSETIKVKGGTDVTFAVRTTRHGPVLSDLDDDRKPEDPILALSAAFLLPNDQTPDALFAMNMARTAGEFRAALAQFDSPQQNAVYADKNGHIGFLAAGRVPVRKKVFASGVLPAPGWTGEYDWIGVIPDGQLPQTVDPANGWLATANNKIVTDDYPHFISGRWPDDGRYRRIAEMLGAKPIFGTEDFEAMQMDTQSAPLRDLMRSWLPQLKDVDPTVIALLARWDGRADRDRPEPLIATLWMSRTAAMLLQQKLGPSFQDWWFWDDAALRRLLSDPKWCAPRSCDAVLSASLTETLSALRARLGDKPSNWKWGALHRMHFRHPVLRNVPLLSDWLDPDLPTDGDMFTVNRGAPIESANPLDLPDAHGPTMRLIVDLKDPMQAVATLAGGQSGNPLSEHYADWLADWRDGRYRIIVQASAHRLTLTPGK